MFMKNVLMTCLVFVSWLLYPGLAVPQDGFRVIGSFPHDPTAYTQGLLYHNNLLYESTGIYGKSTIRKTDLKTGKVVMVKKLATKLFGEGLTLVGNNLYQLTWKSRKGFIYERESLRMKGSFPYQTEGWGLAYDGKEIVMSDGSEKLYFISLEDFKTTKTLFVKGEDGAPVRLINELEYARGKIYCNIYGSDRIIEVNTQTGVVEREIDLGELRKRLSLPARAGVLNGIAWRSSSKTFFVTGKYWSEIFEIEF